MYCLTPGNTGYIHRYYDSSPFSPSGRYVAVTRLPFEDHQPQRGEVAEIAVIDLATGDTRTVAETRGWDVQLGAQLQWGADDRTLLFNDLESGTGCRTGCGSTCRRAGRVASAVRSTRSRRRPLGRQPLSASHGRDAAGLRRRGAEGTHPVIAARAWTTASGSLTCRVGIRGCWYHWRRSSNMRCRAPVAGRRGDFFGFHVKWNPQGRA